MNADTVSILPLGTFNLNSKFLRVTDPCYKLDTWCAGTLENCTPGEWNSVAIILDSSVTGWGDRVSELIVWNRKYDYKRMLFSENSKINVGVDSGQAGFFDLDFYPRDENEFEYEDDKFYGKACALTCDEEIYVPSPNWRILEEAEAKFSRGEISLIELDNIINPPGKCIPKHGGTLEFGAVSSSGYGDGGYNCFVERNENGAIIGAKIVFISDEEEELEELEEDEEEFDFDEEGN